MALRHTVSPANFATILRGAVPKMRRVMERAEFEAAHTLVQRVKHEIQTRDLPDTGALVGSVHVKKKGRATMVVVDAPHAGWIEYGTRPHRPPVQPLIEWAARKLGADEVEAVRIGWAVAAKIEREGTRAHGYFAAAMKDAPGLVRRIITRDLKNKLRLRR